MRYTTDDKAASHTRIVSAAAAQIRERGTDQPGVAEIMRAAGLTHGGFYKHFSSRDELIAEAVGHAMAENVPAVKQLTAEAEDPLAAFADWYTSATHRDDPSHGCGVASLGCDVWRVGGAAQEAYRDQVESYLAILETLLGGEGDETHRQAAVALSAMVGAVMIARALGPTPRSDELLRIVREAVRQRRLDTNPTRDLDGAQDPR